MVSRLDERSARRQSAVISGANGHFLLGSATAMFAAVRTLVISKEARDELLVWTSVLTVYPPDRELRELL
uniref:PH domain-containing protein n=1 Tax=Steinernema glaseri TaxID=37863 RepID=A0A1I7ZXR0_9BILA